MECVALWDMQLPQRRHGSDQAARMNIVVR
jgi:hypothetical protein